MVASNSKYSNVEDCMSLYTSMKRIAAFRCEIRISNIGHEEKIILEVCFEEERPHMDTLNDFPTSYCYLYLHVIHEFGVLIPFTLFEVEVLTFANVASFETMPNGWSVVR